MNYFRNFDEFHIDFMVGFSLMFLLTVFYFGKKTCPLVSNLLLPDPSITETVGTFNTRIKYIIMLLSAYMDATLAAKWLLHWLLFFSMVVLYGSMVIVLFISKVIKFKEKTFVMDPVKIIYSRLDFYLTMILNKRC